MNLGTRRLGKPLRTIFYTNKCGPFSTTTQEDYAMKFETPLVPATFVARYKRFFCDARLEDGTEVTAHCPNPGSMLSLMIPSARIWLAPSAGAGRKLPFRWELVETGGGLVGLNTSRANAIVAEALAEKKIESLRDYREVRREVRYGENSRIDFLLDGDGPPPCYLEVKSVTLSRHPGVAEFPDSVTTRGRKHLEELARMIDGGARAVMLFLVQRNDAERFSIAGDIDHAYMNGLEDAMNHGVDVLCYTCKVNLEAIELHREIPFEARGEGLT
jgi:sugar fermentation stimulation protein A